MIVYDVNMLINMLLAILVEYDNYSVNETCLRKSNTNCGLKIKEPEEYSCEMARNR